MSLEITRQGDSDLVESELYFLICKFLSTGPCTEATKALYEEIHRHELLPKRLDWRGNKHPSSFKDFSKNYPHISNDYLKRLCESIGPILDKQLNSNVRGVQSLLSTGHYSLLRTSKDAEETEFNRRFLYHRLYHRPSASVISKGKYPANIALSIQGRQYIGQRSTYSMLPSKFYSNINLLKRILGHLSCVFCILFDHSGNYIFTGSDDALIKIWSALDGRLLSTLRGHAAEITDMDINIENTLLASGSCDKVIRIWCLQTTAPVAVLSGHTGVINSLKFCPWAKNDLRHLISVANDGNVMFWQYDSKTNQFNNTPTTFHERAKTGAKMMCCAFSKGGAFLATGSADHHVRIFQVAGNGVPLKVFDIEAHMDGVDSMQFANNDYRFISGSKDGTAKIWRFEMQNWRSITLQPNTKRDESGSGKNSQKVRVTMVGWSSDDQYAVTAVSISFQLKIWASSSGQLIHTFKGHEDEVFVVEAHPNDPKIVMSAGHDGKVILWDLHSRVIIKVFDKFIDDQGHGHVFDGRISPNGLSMATTDSHGNLSIFGLFCDKPFKMPPDEQFFHSDYRPLIRDAQQFVLDEQTQQAPHLMPPPFLVDMEGNPYPPAIQRLVRGREKCNDNQLVPYLAVSAGGEAEVLQPIRPHDDDENQNFGDPNIDDMIEIFEAQNRHRAEEGQEEPSADVENRLDANEDQFPVRPGLRRSGVVGVRHAETIHGNWQSMDAQGERQAFTKRCVVKQLSPIMIKCKKDKIIAKGEAELEHYSYHKKKKLLIQDNVDDHFERFIRKQKARRRNSNLRSRGNGSSRLDQENENSTVTVVTSFGRVARRTNFSSIGYENTNNINMDSGESDGEGTWIAIESSSPTDSDWEETPQSRKVLKELQKKENDRSERRSSRRSQRREINDDHYKSDETSDNEEADIEKLEAVERKKPVCPSKVLPLKEAKKASASKKARPRWTLMDLKKTIRSQLPNDLTDVPENFKPPEWLTQCVPKKTPYQPQIGDELMYFPQGHKCYFEAVQRLKKYNINIKHQPWNKINLREQEVVKVLAVKYELKPPRLCCLKLVILDSATDDPNGDIFIIKYHDMQDVIDFLVLRKYYNIAIARNWKQGDQFRSIIDDAWWIGTIESQEPFQAEYPDSMFQCFNVKWDNGEREKMSPWDLEIINESRMPEYRGGGVHVLPSELTALVYQPEPDEWPPCGQDVECDRLTRGFELIMDLGIAEPFNAPVDLDTYPVYAMVVEYPMDLSTIKTRIENRYYRRQKALLFDVKYIVIDANLFNKPGTGIVRKAKQVTELCKRFINNPGCDDPMLLYQELSEEWHLKEEVNNGMTNSSTDDSSVNHGGHYLRGRGGTSHERHNKRSRSRRISSKSWIKDCENLLNLLFGSEDSTPFRSPVNINEYSDYHTVVDTPMDLSAVRKKLENRSYSSPPHFCSDIRLIFENSKNYNTNKKSRIYSMTIRLSATFEGHFRDILSSWKSAVRREQRSKMLRDESLSGEELFSKHVRHIRNAKKRNAIKSTFSNGISNSRSQKNSRNLVESNASNSNGSSSTKASISSEDRRNFRKHVYRKARLKKRPVVKASDSDSSKSSSDMDGLCSSGDDDTVKKTEDSISQNSSSGSSNAEDPSSADSATVAIKSEKDSISSGEDSSEVVPKTSNTRKKTLISSSNTDSPQKTLKNEIKSTSSSNSKSSESESSGSESDPSSEYENSRNGNNKNKSQNKASDLDSSELDSKGSSSQSNASSDLDTEIAKKPVFQPRSTRQNPTRTLRNQSECANNRTNHRKSAKRKMNSDSDERLCHFAKIPKKRMATRNRGKRTVVYQEDSDYEYCGRSKFYSSDESESTSRMPTTSVSSRGRVRRHTPLARGIFN